MIDKPINDSVLIEKLKKVHKDVMTIFTLGKGQLRGAFFNGTRLVNKMRVQHDLGILESFVLGHACICASLLIPTMKGRDRSLFKCNTDGPLSGFTVEAFSEGFVRGSLLQNPIPITSPLTSWDLKPLFGKGTLSITRFPEGAKNPVTGVIELKHKNIALDLTEYFLQSEQTKTGFNSSIQFDKQGRIIGAGGMYIQLMPNADEVLVDKASKAFTACPSIGGWFSEGGNMEDIIFGLFRQCSVEVLLERDINFYCPCSKEYFNDKLLTLPKSELEKLCGKDDEVIELYCHNCGSTYSYNKKSLIS